jgi:large conductance mechanosensitive channel
MATKERKMHQRLREHAEARAQGLKRAAAAVEQRGTQFASGFRDFLKNYGILSLAIAFIIGTQVSKTVSALVNDLLMPVITFFIPEGKWEQWVLRIGSVQLRIGDFLENLLEFVIIALVVYLIAKWILHKDTKEKI